MTRLQRIWKAKISWVCLEGEQTEKAGVQTLHQLDPTCRSQWKIKANTHPLLLHSKVGHVHVIPFTPSSPRPKHLKSVWVSPSPLPWLFSEPLAPLPWMTASFRPPSLPSCSLLFSTQHRMVSSKHKFGHAVSA